MLTRVWVHYYALISFASVAHGENSGESRFAFFVPSSSDKLPSVTRRGNRALVSLFRSFKTGPPPDVDHPRMISLFARLWVVLGTTLALHLSMKKPNPPPDDTNRKRVSHLEFTSQSLLRPLMTCFAFAPGAIELAVTILRLVGSRTTHDIVSNTCAERISFNLFGFFSFLVALSGTGIRLWCYRSLGRFFTFELALLPGHRLIKTGPYAFVRHPSYTGGLLSLVGMTLVNMSKGSWGYECRPISYWWGSGWGMIVGISVILVVERCMREDKFLRETFEEEWDSWSEKVRWRMIPGIY